MLRSDINIIYNDYYDDLKASALFDKSVLISNHIIDYLTKDTKNIYIDIYNDYYYFLFYILIRKIFNHFEDINIIVPINDGCNIQLIELNKNSKFTFTKNGFTPVDCDIYDGEYVDKIFRFCKFFDKLGNYELVNDIILTNLTTQSVIGICIFEPIYEILDFTNIGKLNSYIYPDAAIDIYD